VSIELKAQRMALGVADLVVAIDEAEAYARQWADDPELLESEDTPKRVLRDLADDLAAALKKANER